MAGVPAFFLWLLASFALLLTAVGSRRYWGEPGAKPFSYLTGTLGIAALSFAAIGVDRNFELVAGVVLTMIVPLVWAVFAFDFTGQYHVRSRKRRLLMTAPVLYLVAVHLSVMVLASRRLGVELWAFDMETMTRLIESFTGPAAVLLTTLSVGQFLGYVYLWGLLTLGILVLLRQSLRYDHIGAVTGVPLTAAAIGPWFVYMVTFSVSGSTTVGASAGSLPIAVSFAASGAIFPVIVAHYDLFDATPVAGTVGPDRVFEDMREPVVVTDHVGRIVTLNPAGRDAFEHDDCLGKPLVSLVGHDLDALRDAETLDLSGTDGQGLYEPSVSRMTDRNDRLLGFAVVLREVTDREVRRQRLQVLNRVLRHNLRNDMTAIRGRAELLTDGNGQVSEIGTAITHSADELVDLGDRAREIEKMLSVPPDADRMTDLAEIVSAVVGDLDERHDVDIDVAIPEDLGVAVDERVLEPVVRNLLDNAAAHHDQEDPWVRVSATQTDDPLPIKLVVQDDGPGIPNNERVSIVSGREEPLEHGSGLGLWAVKWGVTRMGGQLSIEENKPRGTVVEIEMPGASSPADGDGTAMGTASDGA